MKKLRVRIHNLTLFVALALWRGTPLRLWPRAWREVEADHRARIHKTVWALKCEGRVREDREGRLWPVKKK